MLLCKFSEQGRPPRLMTRAQTGARLSVKVLIEQYVVAPVRIVLKGLLRTKDRTVSVYVALENTDEAA